MGNGLLDTLRKDDKNKLFEMTETSISYATGFPPLDYKNGYTIDVRDMDEKLVDSYKSLGLSGGTYTTIVGKSGTAKTTFAVQAISNIVTRFENGLCIHYDLEQATSITRIKNITGMTNAQIEKHYVLKQEKNTIEDILDAIIAICKAKRENPKEFRYDSGLKNEMNRDIIPFVPTYILLDSIPTISSRDISKDEMEGSTYASRMAKTLTQFYRKAIPYLKEFNINLVAINHIQAKIEINPMMKSQPQLMYLKMDESLPGGNASVYYAHQVFKFVSSGKLTIEKDGIDGFNIRCELLKSRTNKAGQFASLVYNQVTGFDPYMSLYKIAHEEGLIQGRNPYRYFKGYDDAKFDTREIETVFNDKEDVRDALIKSTRPILMSYLSDKNTRDNKEATIEAACTILDIDEHVELS